MSKVIAEYNATLPILKQNEERMIFTGSLALCDDGKVLGVVSRFEGPDNARLILGMHYKIQHGGTLSIARLDDRGFFGDETVADFAILHGDYLPESTGSREFGGLHSIAMCQAPQSILNALAYSTGISAHSIEKFRDISVADIENLLGNKKKLYDRKGADRLEKEAVKSGQTMQVFLTPKA